MLSPKQSRWIGLLLITGLALTLTGCVKESNSNGDRIFQYEWWVPLGVLLGGLAAVPLGLLLKNWVNRVGWALIVLGPLAALFLAPSLYLDRMVLNNKGFHLQTGIWGMTAVHTLEFDNIRQIRIIAEVSGGRGQRVNYYMMCDTKSGESRKVPMTNAVAEASAQAILREAAAHGIPIRDETGGK